MPLGPTVLLVLIAPENPTELAGKAKPTVLPGLVRVMAPRLSVAEAVLAVFGSVTITRLAPQPRVVLPKVCWFAAAALLRAVMVRMPRPEAVVSSVEPSWSLDVGA